MLNSLWPSSQLHDESLNRSEIFHLKASFQFVYTCYPNKQYSWGVVRVSCICSIYYTLLFIVFVRLVIQTIFQKKLLVSSVCIE